MKTIGMLIISLASLGGCAAFIKTQPSTAEETIKSVQKVILTQNTNTVPIHEVFEITFQHEQEYDNPFFDVVIDVTFHSPSGKSVTIGGFHYGSSRPPQVHISEDQRGRRHNQYEFEKQDIWKARFAPAELGQWSYQYTFANNRGMKTTGTGSLACVAGKKRSQGFLRQHPDNPFRWVFDDGTPYFPMGLQEGWGDGNGNGTELDAKSMEGPFWVDRTGRIELPPGPLYVHGPSKSLQNADVYARRHSRAGFNLYRFSQRNNTHDLYRDLDHYLVQEGVMTDEILQHLRNYGFRIMYGLFGYQKVFNDEPDNAEGMAKVKQFVKYSVDRWGAYVDIWEFLNEQEAADGWYEIMIPYLRSIDPYRHPITTSWERPELDGIDINAPHWYENENELRSDKETVSRANKWKQHGKPVIVGEQGNAAVYQDKPRPPGIGGVWDEGSARRMRIRSWTALFNEIVFIFWNTSYARDGHYMNIWLGPQERQYIRVMQDFAYRLDADVRMVPVTVSMPEQVRAFGLASESRAGVYLHHFENHNSPVEELTITVDVPITAEAYWYSPENAVILGSFHVLQGEQTLKVPSFMIDLALLVTPNGAPDIDHDGIPNYTDPDNDNDGVPDVGDAFPLESGEWEDRDRDLIGDNLDADINGDGIGDDTNHNGTPDHEELDFDGDGVDRARSVPWDAFPLESGEWRDTDGDGVGDNTDTDDDGDEWSDTEERMAETDPLDKLSFPIEQEPMDAKSGTIPHTFCHRCH